MTVPPPATRPAAGPGPAESPTDTAALRRAALRGGIVGNFVDQLHIFLPLTALAPALPALVGDDAVAGTAALAITATLLGRPLGAVVFGRLADRAGRTRVTQAAIAGTAACTAAIALLPDHRAIGGAAMALVLLLRFAGGMFLAGEYTSAVPLAMEWAKPRRRGLLSGLIMAMAPWAQATVAVSTLILLALLGPSAYAAYGWRCAFGAGALASLAVLLYYRRRVADARPAPAVARERSAARGNPEAQGGPEARCGTEPAAGSVRALVAGAQARAFWQVFALMSGLWLLTNMVVLQLAAALSAHTVGAALPAQAQPLVMAVAAVAQALVMSATGQLSTLLGRRRFFVAAGLLAAADGPAVYALLAGGRGLLAVCLLAAALQAVTVTAYGPVGAYLAERFPAHQRSVGYGAAYSVSIVIPALYPLWLPPLGVMLGSPTAAVGLVLALGGLLVAGAGALGPALRPAELDAAMARPTVGAGGEADVQPDPAHASAAGRRGGS